MHNVGTYGEAVNHLIATTQTRFLLVMESGHELNSLTKIDRFIDVLTGSSRLSMVGGCHDEGKAMRIKLNNGTLDVNTDFTCEEYALGGVGSFLHFDSGAMIEDCYSTMIIGTFFMMDLEQFRSSGIEMDTSLPYPVIQHYDFFMQAKEHKLGIALCNNPTFNVINGGIHLATMTSFVDTTQIWQPLVEKRHIEKYFVLLFSMY